MKKKTIITFAAGAVTASVAGSLVLGSMFVNTALNTDRIKTKGNKILRTIRTPTSFKTS